MPPIEQMFECNNYVTEAGLRSHNVIPLVYNFSMTKIIRVYCIGSSGKLIDLGFDSDNFTVETAEQSCRDKGFTVIYSTQNV